MIPAVTSSGASTNGWSNAALIQRSGNLSDSEHGLFRFAIGY